MKIGIISDIHVDINEKAGIDVVAPIIEEIKKNEADIVLMAGDLSNDYQLTLNTLEKIQKESGSRCIFVPGNHDIWNDNYPHKDAWFTYNELKKFPGNVCNGPIELNDDWVIIGDLGWYDYSFGDPTYTVEDFDKMQYEERVWQDKIKSIWDRSTLDMHKYFYDKIEAQLKKYKDKKIILMTHVVPHENFTVLDPNDMWKYINAFMGGKSYGELGEKYKVEYMVFGHIHHRNMETINGVTYVCNCLSYSSEWEKLFGGTLDPYKEVPRAFRFIEI